METTPVVTDSPGAQPLQSKVYAHPSVPLTPTVHIDSHSHSHSHGGSEPHAHAHSHGHAHSHQPEVSIGHSTSVAVSQSTPFHHQSLEAYRGRKEANAQAWLFFIALSIHSIFDGLGVGAADNVANFYALLTVRCSNTLQHQSLSFLSNLMRFCCYGGEQAVLTHKALDGFALGVPVFMARWKFSQTAFALTFCAAMTPLGVVIGMAATDTLQGSQALLSKAVILSMSGKIFLFLHDSICSSDMMCVCST